jgi:hypothetical protein
MFWLGCILALIAMADSLRSQSPADAAPRVSGTISFRGLWWSEEQKTGLNANSPPPKQTEVAIEKWEYSDPVEVPHPDVVDVVFDFRNETTAELKGLTIRFSARWHRKLARWGKPVSLKRLTLSKLDAQSADSLRVPVKVGEKTKKLFASGSWPWALRVRVTISDAGGKILHKGEADLPIIPGD